MPGTCWWRPGSRWRTGWSLPARTVPVGDRVHRHAGERGGRGERATDRGRGAAHGRAAVVAGTDPHGRAVRALLRAGRDGVHAPGRRGDRRDTALGMDDRVDRRRWRRLPLLRVRVE